MKILCQTFISFSIFSPEDTLPLPSAPSTPRSRAQGAPGDHRWWLQLPQVTPEPRLAGWPRFKGEGAGSGPSLALGAQGAHPAPKPPPALQSAGPSAAESLGGNLRHPLGWEKSGEMEMPLLLPPLLLFFRFKS